MPSFVTLLQWYYDLTLLSYMVLEEYNVYNTGLVPSIFYEVIDGRDAEGFKSVLWQAAIVILSVVLVSEDQINHSLLSFLPLGSDKTIDLGFLLIESSLIRI